MEHEGDDDTNCNRCARNNPQKISKETRKVGNRINRDHPNYSILKISLNTEKNPKELRRLSLT